MAVRIHTTDGIEGNTQSAAFLLTLVLFEGSNYYHYYYYVELRIGFFPGEKYPVKSHPETSDFQHFSEDMCRSKGCRLLHRSCLVLSS